MTGDFRNFLAMPRRDERVGVGAVLFVAERATDAMLDRYSSQGAAVVEIEAPSLDDQTKFVAALQDKLPFPSWCGVSLDSMNDAFPELVESFPFPVMVALRRFDVLARRDLPLAGLLIHYCTNIRKYFARAGKQFNVHFCIEPVVEAESS